MFKWIGRAFAVLVVGSFGMSIWDSYKGGFFNLPEFDDHSYAISFTNGLRAIVVNPDIPEPEYKTSRFFRRLSQADRSRRYFGLPLNVPEWFQDAWVFCDAPTEEEAAWISAEMPAEQKQQLVGARLDAVCMLEIDGQEMPRGLIYSVPRL